MNKTVLILGSCGFIGSHLKVHMQQYGFECIGVDIRKGAEICHDISGNPIQSELESILPDIIIDCAAIVGVQNVIKHPFMTFHNNYAIPFTINRLIHHTNVTKQYRPNVIFLSTSELYGNTQSENDTVFDIDPRETRSIYAISKLLGEYFYLDVKRNNYIDNLHIMRLFNIVGTGQNHEFSLPKMCRDMIANQKVLANTHYREFCHVDFLCDFITHLCQIEDHSSIPDIFDFGSRNIRNNIRMDEVAKLVKESYERHTGKTVDDDFIIWDSDFLKSDRTEKKVQHKSVDINRIFSELIPEYDMEHHPLDIGISDIIDEIMQEQMEEMTWKTEQ